MANSPNTNEHNLDCAYFHKKLQAINRDLRYYRPDELARALTRLALTADRIVAEQTIAAEAQTRGCTLCKNV